MIASKRRDGVRPISRSPDIEDAEFVTLPPDARAHERHGAVASARSAKTSHATPLPVFAAVATLASCVSFYAAGGHALFNSGTNPAIEMERVPNKASFSLSNVSTRIDTARGAPVLVIRGDINASEKGGIVPNLAIRFLDEDTGQGVTYTIPRGELLQANESLGFTTRIPAGKFAGVEPAITLEGS